MIRQGDVWWADLATPVGSAPGFRRPVVVVQGDPINRSGISTVVVVPMTGNMNWAPAPTCLALSTRETGLDRASVAQANAIQTVDAGLLIERVGRISERKLSQLFRCLDVALDREV